MRWGPSSFVVTFEGGERLLRFPNEVANASTGVLELFPVEGDCDGDGDSGNDRMGYQRMYRDTNDNGRFDRGADRAMRPRFAGCFQFHPEHDHWHFENFARYQLKRMSDGKLVRTSDKVSFCIVDIARRFPAIPGSPTRSFYNRCARGTTSGLSVGWSDIYSSGLEGQSLIITTLVDGHYCFVSTADPANLLVERNDGNNKASTHLVITGDRVQNLGSSCG